MPATATMNPPIPVPALEPLPQITRYPYLNRAVVVVGGTEYFEWESVSVRCALMEVPPRTCRLTCSEMEPDYPTSRSAFRIRPGDSCSVILDGYLVITGIVATRQVFYDAKQHTVEIQACSQSAILGHGAAQQDGGQFLKQDAGQIATKLAGQLGVGVKVMGDAGQALDRFSIRPGEHAGEAIERAARMGKMFMTGDAQGNLVLMSGPLGGGGSAIEGVNILEGREVIHSLSAASGYETSGQGPGSDDHWGAIKNLMHDSQGSMSDFSPGNMPQKLINEIPSFTQSILQARGGMENNVSDMNQIFVTVSLLGWQRQTVSGGLWEPGETVVVNSPMLIMFNNPLILKAVTFSQDNNTGTRSTLELVNYAAFGGYAQQ